MEYCYSVVFDRGVIKFGRTANLSAKISSHISIAASHGDVCTAVVVGSATDTHTLLAEIISTANDTLEKHPGREYYLGDCDDAVSVMMRAGMTPTVATPTKDGSGLNFLVSKTAQVAKRYRIISKPDESEGVEEAIIRVLKSGPKTGGVLVSRLRRFDRDDVEGALPLMVKEGFVRVKKSVHPRNGQTVLTYNFIDRTS